MNVINRHSKVKVIQGLISADHKQDHVKLILMFPLYESCDRRVRIEHVNLSEKCHGLKITAYYT